MLTILVNILLLVIVALVVLYVTKYVLAQAEVDEPIRKIALLIIALVFIIALVNILTGGPLWGPVVVVR